jgi:2-methylcitrate dehydratase PrpD
MALGRADDVAVCMRNTLVNRHKDPEAQLLLTVMRKSSPSASLVNGVASHAQKQDDVALVGIQPTQPSACIAPAILPNAGHLHCDDHLSTAARRRVPLRQRSYRAPALLMASANRCAARAPTSSHCSR